MLINLSAMQIYFCHIPFRMTPQKLKYLGIWITHNFKDLYKANFPPLILCLKQDIECWDLLSISLGRIINTIIKMNVLRNV